MREQINTEITGGIMNMMKKLMLVPVILGTVVLVPVAAEASTAGSERATVVNESSSNLAVQPRGRWNRRPRTVIRTRIRSVGFRRYRETVRITYLPNGRVRTQVISRVRIR